MLRAGCAALLICGSISLAVNARAQSSGATGSPGATGAAGGTGGSGAVSKTEQQGLSPLEKDLLLVLGTATTVLAVAAAALARWIKQRVLDTLRSDDAARVIQTATVRDEDIRRVLTAEVVASLLDGDKPRERIVAALGSDGAQARIVAALDSDAARDAIAGALLSDNARERLQRFLETDVEARRAISAMIDDANTTARVLAILRDPAAERIIVDVLSGELGDVRLTRWLKEKGTELISNDISIARAIARSLRHGLYEEKEALEALQDMLAPVKEAQLEAALRKLEQKGHG